MCMDAMNRKAKNALAEFHAGFPLRSLALLLKMNYQPEIQPPVSTYARNDNSEAKQSSVGVCLV